MLMIDLKRFSLVTAAWLSILAPVRASETGLIRLTRWEDQAVLMVNHAPGTEYFELHARFQWDREREREGLNPEPLELRVRVPDGRTEGHAIPTEELHARRLTVLVPETSVRNLRRRKSWSGLRSSIQAPESPVSNTLTASIDDFPHPQPPGPRPDPGPFGWGRPLDGRARAQLLPRPNGDGFRFVRILNPSGRPTFYLSIGEASNAQVASRLTGYDPKAGRSDEFALENPAQPAIGLTPARALDFLNALSKSDPARIVYRLPTVEEWNLAARAGKDTPFWWGTAPGYPQGANFLGPEPALAVDSTAPAVPAEGTTSFDPNPWGLFHTFGNVAEWATLTPPAHGFTRLGGHFRTEPEAPLPEVAVEGEATTGPDLYAGLRPGFDLSTETGTALVRRALAGNRLLAGLSVRFDPDRATVTLEGKLPDTTLQRAADRRLAPLWFLAAVENRAVTPELAPGQLATLGSQVAPPRRLTPMGHWLYELRLSVRWTDPLPVRGSEWWVNVYSPHGGHHAHRLASIDPAASPLIVRVDRDWLGGDSQGETAAVDVALSLGAPAPTPGDPRVVSNVVRAGWRGH